MEKLDTGSMQGQNDNLKEMLDESVTLLDTCRKSAAMSKEILGALHWMRYLCEEESTPSSATHFLAFMFPFVKQAAIKPVGMCKRLRYCSKEEREKEPKFFVASYQHSSASGYQPTVEKA
ncbi:hypothetical protein llap_2241 [Limosa lapponica baueri]|uniref:Uncharacterized protein n=1 Tax=Limosa lapponica baueri TaxID=1758121 RepID=A0A2I0UMZ7_LIMLA|nr:hypothetical protein llap_2241 [Limosa lapponica baueri]